MSYNLDKKIDDFLQIYFPDIDFEYQGHSRKLKEEQIWSLKYEYFVNAFEVYNFKKEIDTEDTKRLSAGTLRGIDSLYLVLNNKFFAIPEEKDEDYLEFVEEIDLRLKDALIEATFLFNQIKSNETNLQDFNGFCDSVYDIFDLTNDTFSKFNRVTVLRSTFGKIAKKTEMINLHLKFCSIKKDMKKMSDLAKKWDPEISKKKKELISTNFKKVAIDLTSGQDYLNKLNNFNSPNKREIEIVDLKNRFIEHIVENTKTYFGFLNLLEVIEILKNEEGDFDDNNVFFDNIRYFQGDTAVNSKILKSLNTNGKIFHTLHNGIIITSNNSQFNMANGNLVLSGFSIVNGCQTCNMIWKWYEQRSLGKNNTLNQELKSYKIPTKLVITPDFELRNKITEAANTQNPIKSLNLIAISDTAKSLESKFKELEWIKRKEKLVFQRLPNPDNEISRFLNVSLEDVARAFYSVFKQQPHEISRSFGKYLEEKLNLEDFLSDKMGKEYDINSYLVTAIVSNYLLRFLKSRYRSLMSLKNHFLLLFFIYLDVTFINMDPKRLSNDFVQKVLLIVDDKDQFERICTYICEFAKNSLSFFVDNSIHNKPKVIPKSYYSEENTKKMLEKFRFDIGREQ
jgi:hypothetical protein